MSTRKGSWTVSVWGRRVFRGTAISLIGGTFLAHYLPQTIFIEKLKAITQIYKKGIPVPLPNRVQSLVQQVIEEVGMGELKERITLYTSFGYEFFHAGTPHSRWGGLLGVPTNLKWEVEEDFDVSNTVVNNTPVSWDTEAGQKLRQSLILSENAKKFVLARELHSLNASSPFTQASIPLLSLTIAYSTSLGINKKLDLYARPKGLRLCLYLLTSLLGFSFYIFGKDMGTVRDEEESDKKAALMGMSYAEGGVEFYDKILQRNVALRELMGSDGAKMYSVKGNDEVLFRTRHLPFTYRLDNLKQYLNQYKEEERT